MAASSRVRVQLQANQLAAKVMAISEKAEEVKPAAQNDLRMVTPATSKKDFKFSLPKSNKNGSEASNGHDAAPPPPLPPASQAPNTNISSSSQPPKITLGEDDEEELNLDTINRKSAAANPPVIDAMDIDGDDTIVLPPPKPKTSTSEVPVNASPKDAKKKNKEEEPKSKGVDKISSKEEEKKKKKKKTKQNPRRKLEFIEMEAEDENDDEEDDSDEANSEDLRFIAPDDEIEYEDEEAAEADQANRKKKGRKIPVDPFRAQELKEETKKMRKLAALYENDSADKKSRTSLLKDVSGIKGIGVDKTYRNDDSEELDADAEQALADRERDKVLGDDEDDDISEGERVRREEAEDAAAAADMLLGDKPGKKKKNSSLALDLSEDDDDPMSVDDDGGDDAASDNDDEGEENDDKEAEPEPVKPAPQVAKGKITTITFDDDDDDDNPKVVASTTTATASATPTPSAPTKTVDEPKAHVGSIDRRKVASEQVPKIKGILIEKRIRERDAPSILLEGLVAAKYLATSSGMTGNITKSKPNQDTLNKIGQIMEPFQKPIELLTEKIIEETEISNKMEPEKLLPIVLTIGTDLKRMKLCQNVRAAKAHICAFTGQVIQPDSYMNILMVCCDDLKFASGKTQNRILYIPVALSFPIAKKMAAAASSTALPASKGKKASPAPPTVPDAPLMVPVAAATSSSNKNKKSPAAEENEDPMEVDQVDDSVKATNAKEESDDDEEEHEEDDEEHEEDEPEEMQAEPTEPKERLDQGFDGVIIKKLPAFIKFNEMVRTLLETTRVVVAWKPQEGSGDAVQLFDPATNLPKVEHPWTGLTTVGLFANLFELRKDIKSVKGYKRIGGDDSWLYFKSSDLDTKDLGNLILFAMDFNKQAFFNMWNLVEQKKGSLSLDKIQNTAGAVMVNNALAYDDEKVKPFFEKPEKGQYFLERIRFLPRLLAQLLLKEPVYVAKKNK